MNDKALKEPFFSSLTSTSLSDTCAIAKEFAKELMPGSVVLLLGDLGSGKTTFCSSIIAELLGKERHSEVTSPTFGLMNQYPGQDFSVCHFDLYRLSSFDEFAMRGFSDYLHDEKTICLIEWGEELRQMVCPNKTWKCEIKIGPQENRIFTISKLR